MIRRTNSTKDDHKAPPDNEVMAEALEEVAELLNQQGANRFRVEAYRRAAETMRDLMRPVWQIYEEEGREGLEDLPAVGHTISRALEQMIGGGRWVLLDRLRGEGVAEQAFASVPNIGPVMAHKIHETLGIESLAELQAAAWDGRLANVPGMGEKRLRAVRESLSARGRLAQPAAATQTQQQDDEMAARIPVAELLDIDDEYRRKSEQNKLPRIAPRRFNPAGERWLPILHTERFGRHYTALYSNTARAHEMGTTHDWVVIYLEDHDQSGNHGRWTVITSRFGKLRGRRIVRGREAECGEYYDQNSDR
ncbi:MAG: helix-hairpin-helix domain-containing protein [Pirellulaceae bacterium]